MIPWAGFLRAIVRHVWQLLTLIALTAPAVWAQDCTVLGTAQLASSDYVLHYEGGCHDGLAQGEGRASWSLRHAADAEPVTWQGRFDHGIFLAPQAVQGAMALDRTRVLLDLGQVPAPAGASQSGRLWAESRLEGKQPASACDAIVLHVLAGDGARFSADALARAWLEAAYQYWDAQCPDAAAARPAYRLPVQLHARSTIAPDAYGNLLQASVRAVRVPGAGKEGAAWQQYLNRDVQAEAQARQEAEQERERLESRARLRAFAQEVGASQFVTAGGLDQNPFRFGSQVLLLAVELVEVRTPTQAYVRALASRQDRRWSLLRVEGGVSGWDDRSRLIAVRVKGRTDTGSIKGLLQLELVGSRACADWDCADYLLGPGGWWQREGRLD